MRRALSLIAFVGGCRACSAEVAHDASPTVDDSAALDAAIESAASADVIDATTPIDRQAYATYVDALTHGRRATLAKDWPGAIAAFNDALRIRTHDERALAELGYVELLSGDTTAARGHLESARYTEDKELLAQVWFNLGLVTERETAPGDSSALLYFWLSNSAHATSAAGAKIAGKSICPVTFDKKRIAARHFTSWLALARVVQAGSRCPAATTEAAARALADTNSLTTPSGELFVVRDGALDLTKCVANVVYVVQALGSDLWLYPQVASGTYVWMNPSEESVSLERASGAVHASVAQSFMREVMVCSTPDGGAIFDCTGAPGEVPFGMAHPSSPTEYDEWIYDPASHDVTLKIHDDASGRFGPPEGKRAIAVTATGGDLALNGLGCHETLHIP